MFKDFKHKCRGTERQHTKYIKCYFILLSITFGQYINFKSFFVEFGGHHWNV